MVQHRLNPDNKGFDPMDNENKLTSRPAIMAYGAIAVVLAVVVGALYVAPLMAGPKQAFADYNVGSGKVAIHGYDTVAYFTEGEPTKGNDEFEHTWEDAKWQFATATNRDLFKANPDRYAPQYGGYCAYAVANNSTAKIDPEAWKIVDGKLYLNYSKDIQKTWEADQTAFIMAADKNWPGVLN